MFCSQGALDYCSSSSESGSDGIETVPSVELIATGFSWLLSFIDALDRLGGTVVKFP